MFWPIAEAKRQLKKVINTAIQKHEPQFIISRGVKRAVVISIDDYELLFKSRGDLKTTLLSCPVHFDEQVFPDREMA